MRKIFVTILLAAFSATGAFAQQNVLERGLEGRSLNDELSRKYIAPVRIVELPGAVSAGVSGAGMLLEPFFGQLYEFPVPSCVLSTRGGREAAVMLDFGKEITGGIRIAAPIRVHENPVKVRVRLGESVSEAMSDALSLKDRSEPMSTATNAHAMRDFIVEVPWLGTIEVGNSGFRFVRLDLVEPDVELPIKAVTAVMRYRDLPYLGSFGCSDPRLTSVWETGAYTVHLNMQEYLWDGIKRDRLVWMGDMHPEVMTVNSVFGINPVVSESLDLASDRAPLPGWMNGIPSYSMWWIIIQRDLYLYGGDLDYLRQQREYMNGLFGQLADGIEDGRETLEGWRFLDWPTSESPEAIHAGYQAMLRMSFEAGVQMGEWLGDSGMVKVCREGLLSMGDYVPAHNDNKQAASLLALAGLISPAKGGEVVSKGGPDGFSTFYGYYMLESLARAGLYTEAMDIISQYWGAMLDLGATTFWEDLIWADVPGASRIDEVVPAGKFDIHADSGAYCYLGLRHSLCHGWASGPTAWLSRHVLGVEPLEPGFRKVRIAPNLGDLEWAEGSFPTPYGVVTVRHEKRKTGRVISDVKAPPQVEVILN